MKRKLIIFGISLLVIINLSSLATIGYHRCFRKGEECPKESKYPEESYLHRQLSLTKSQAEKMKTLRDSFYLQSDKISSDLLERRTELVELLMASEPDTEKINEALSEIDSKQAELQKKVINCLLEEKEILTPEQQQEFFSIIKERLLHEACNHQTNMIDPVENNDNLNCQKLNKSLKNK